MNIAEGFLECRVHLCTCVCIYKRRRDGETDSRYQYEAEAEVFLEACTTRVKRSGGGLTIDWGSVRWVI